MASVHRGHKRTRSDYAISDGLFDTCYLCNMREAEPLVGCGCTYVCSTCSAPFHWCTRCRMPMRILLRVIGQRNQVLHVKADPHARPRDVFTTALYLLFRESAILPRNMELTLHELGVRNGDKIKVLM